MSGVAFLIVGTGGTTVSTVTDYRAYLGRSHTVTARILASINGSPFTVPVPYVAGSGKVRVTGGTGVARSMTCTVACQPDDVRVDPFATEWRADYGIVQPNGDTLWVPVATLALRDVQQNGEGTVQVSAADRWLRVQRARFERTRVTSGSTLAALTAMLTDADARITVDTTRATSSATHRTSVWDRDRDKAVQALARSIGHEVRFDPLGVAVIAPAPTADDPVFWTVERNRGGTKVSSRRGVTSERTYNAVAVVGQTPGGDPVYAVVRDNTPGSRTLWGGPAGKITRFLKSDLISTSGQATAAGQALLAKARAVPRTLTVEALPHPGLDSGHVLDVEVAPRVWERHLVDEFDLPLGAAGPVSIATRSQLADLPDEGA